MVKTINKKSIFICLATFLVLYVILWFTIFTEVGKETDPMVAADPFFSLSTISNSQHNIDCNNDNSHKSFQKQQTSSDTIIWDVDYEIAFESWLSLKKKWLYNCPKSHVCFWNFKH